MTRTASENTHSPEGRTHGLRAELAYGQLLERVVKGRLAPGEPVKEARISQLLGVSRTPVRDALSRLAREGFLVSSNRGRRTELEVTQLSVSDVVELWGLMGALEGFSIQTVSELGRERCRELARVLTDINDDLVAACDLRPWDSDLVADLGSRFHVCFMDACAGPRVLALYKTVRPHVERYEWAYGTQVSADYRLSTDEHLAIITAVEVGDGQLAKALIEKHWAADTERTCATIAPLVDPAKASVRRATSRDRTRQ